MLVANEARASMRTSSQDAGSLDTEPIVVGFVNNMPDAALRTTERQFRELLSAASWNLAVCLRFFSLPDLPRSEAGRLHLSQNYEDIRELSSTHLDGLIVTGTEPRASALPDEPYWGSLVKLIEWAEGHTSSTVWSCLAAHAAVLQNDGIGRRLLGKKLSGVFDCVKVTDHPILAGVASQWRVPHSRHNEVPEEELVAKGYCILSRSAEAGADIFVKQTKNLSIFVQGHPEYDPEALLREYRRDIGRFLSGERDNYPEMPRGYFDAGMAAALSGFQTEASRKRNIDLLSRFPAGQGEGRLDHPWRTPAVRIYANWLSYLAERKFRDHWSGEGVHNSARSYREPNRNA